MKSALPKVLHRIGGRALLSHVIAAARGAGVERIVLVVSREHEPIRNLVGADFAFVIQEPRLGTGHALQQAQTALRDFCGDVIVLCGDAPLVTTATIREMIDLHRREGNACTVLTALVDNPKDYGRIVRDKAGHVTRIVEEKEASAKEKEICEVNSGAYCLKYPAAAVALSRLERKMAGGELPLTDIVESLAKSGAKVGGFRTVDNAEIMGINSRGALAQAERILQKRIAAFHMDNGVGIVDPSNTYIGSDVTIGQDSMIEPFTVIEGCVRIGQGCVVGPFAHLRDGTVLEDGAEIGNFVEVKKSLIGAHSKAKHLSYLGDATLGQKVNIGAGTITANYDGKKKHATHIEDGASIGSNSTLVAPVRIGAGAVTGAGSVILSQRNVPAGAVVVGVPARELSKSQRRGQ